VDAEGEVVIVSAVALEEFVVAVDGSKDAGRECVVAADDLGFVGLDEAVEDWETLVEKLFFVSFATLGQGLCSVVGDVRRKVWKGGLGELVLVEVRCFFLGEIDAVGNDELVAVRGEVSVLGGALGFEDGVSVNDDDQIGALECEVLIEGSETIVADLVEPGFAGGGAGGDEEGWEVWVATFGDVPSVRGFVEYVLGVGVAGEDDALGWACLIGE
jgi:hypothetical protein